ncbi:MAG: hypothetical protein Q7N50_12795 [Armatimonadota bacterium]|nr:hypothetical protein [Armatimonadota bacterium]
MSRALESVMDALANTIGEAEDTTSNVCSRVKGVSPSTDGCKYLSVEILEGRRDQLIGTIRLLDSKSADTEMVGEVPSVAKPACGIEEPGINILREDDTRWADTQSGAHVMFPGASKSGTRK